MRIEDFSELVEFPKPQQGVVYVLFWTDPAGKPVPFYVGQTGRYLWSRMIEYLSADFQATTDFKVGEAIRYLSEVKGIRVLLGYQASLSPPADEQQVKRDFLRDHRLLNDCLWYDYKTASPEAERAKIHALCEEILGSH